jgi:hypothetical protein
VTPSNEHLVHDHLSERLAGAEAYRAPRIVDERHAPHRPGREPRRILSTLALSLHPTRKERPA